MRECEICISAWTQHQQYRKQNLNNFEVRFWEAALTTFLLSHLKGFRSGCMRENNYIKNVHFLKCFNIKHELYLLKETRWNVVIMHHTYKCDVEFVILVETAKPLQSVYNFRVQCCVKTIAEMQQDNKGEQVLHIAAVCLSFSLLPQLLYVFNVSVDAHFYMQKKKGSFTPTPQLTFHEQGCRWFTNTLFNLSSNVQENIIRNQDSYSFTCVTRECSFSFNYILL